MPLNENIMNSEVPYWFQIMNLEADLFEKSIYASEIDRPKFRLKNLNILRKLFPGVYESAAEEVKEDNQYYFLDGGKAAIGKKKGSIPLEDFALHPELRFDPKEREKYWKENPQFRAVKQNPKLGIKF